MSQTGYHDWHLRLDNPKCINTITLYSLLSIVIEYNIRRVRGGEKVVKKIRST